MKRSSLLCLGFLIVLLVLPLSNLSPKVYGSSPETYYSGAGDGSVGVGGDSVKSWATVHHATSGGYVYNTSTTVFAESYEGTEGLSYNAILRNFLPFNTAALPDTATITAATLNIYVIVTVDEDNDGYDYVSVVQTTQASATSLVLEDYDQCGAVQSPQKGAADIDITGISSSAYLTFTLNATGIGWISLTGWTQLGIREGHDVADHQILANKDNCVIFSSSEASGTLYDPYLTITYTVPGGGPLSFYGSASLTFAPSVSKTMQFNRYGEAVLTFASIGEYWSGVILNLFGSALLVFTSDASRLFEVYRYGSSILTFATASEKAMSFARYGGSTLTFLAEALRNLARMLSLSGSANFSFLSEQLRTFTFNRYGTAPLSFTVESIAQGLGTMLTFFGSASFLFTIQKTIYIVGETLQNAKIFVAAAFIMAILIGVPLLVFFVSRRRS